MASTCPFQPGQRVMVIDPEDGYYLAQGEVEEVQGNMVYVAFAADDTGQRFRAGQLGVALDVEAGPVEGGS